MLTLPAEINASFTRIALRMVERGANLGLPYTKAMGSGSFEIRAKWQEDIGRAIFCTLVEQRMFEELLAGHISLKRKFNVDLWRAVCLLQLVSLNKRHM